MSGTTPRLGLKTFDQSDPFLRQDFNDNNSRLDSYPGPYICTSQTRPAWGAAQSGMRIYETDTRREMVWSGTAWREVLSAPPVWTGTVTPMVALGGNTHVYYKLATFTVNRPGALAVWLTAEANCDSIYAANIHVRPQIDGSDAHIGTDAYERVVPIDRSGAGYGRHFQIPAMGLRQVGVGSHNIGIHFYTTPITVTSSTSTKLISARAVAVLVNSADT